MDPMNPPGGTPPGNGTPPDGGADGSGTTTTTTTGGSDELAQPSKREWVDFRKELRDQNQLLKQLITAQAPKPDGSVRTQQQQSTQQQAPITTTATAPAWGASEQLAFRDALEEAEVKISVPQRKVLEKLYRADAGGITDAVAWVRENAATLGWHKAAGQVAAPPQTQQQQAPQQRVFDPGAPTGTAAGATSIPDDPALLPQSVIDQMTPADAAAHYKRWQEKQRGFRHPFQAAREAERAKSTDAAKLADAIAQALSQKR